MANINKIRIFTLGAISLLFTTLFAQPSEKSKKEIQLPKQGDIALGIDLKPFFQGCYDFLNGSYGKNNYYFGGSASYGDQLLPSPTASIYGKYLLTDNIALKANIGMIINNLSDNFYVKDDVSAFLDPLKDVNVEDRISTQSRGASFKLGGEYRRGYNRLHGYFGANLLFAFQGIDKKFTYGNAITEINQRPSQESPFDTDGYRPLHIYNEDGKKNTYGGLVLDFGIEYFILPRISIGGEVNLAAYFIWGAKRYQVAEGFNHVTSKVEKRVYLTSPGDNRFVLSTDNIGTNLSLNFYF